MHTDSTGSDEGYDPSRNRLLTEVIMKVFHIKMLLGTGELKHVIRAAYNKVEASRAACLEFDGELVYVMEE